MRQATLMNTKPIEPTSRGSDLRSINADSGQRMSCGAAIQIKLWPTSMALKPRTEPRYSGIRYAVARMVRRRKPISSSWLGMGGPNTTLRLSKGCGVRNSCKKKTAMRKKPASISPHTRTEFSQSSRLP
jgi:hypothetical protein